MKKAIFKKASDLPSRRYPATQKIGGLCLVLSVLFALLGCQQAPESTANTDGLPDSGRIAELEALYGQDKAAALEALEVTEDTESQMTARGMWNLRETAALQGTEFSQALLCNAADDTLYGIRYWYRTDDSDQAVQLIQGLLDEGRKLYGEPTTYPGLSNLLSADSFSTDFEAAMVSGSLADWREEWAVGETTLCTLSVSVNGPNTAVIFVDYSLAV